MKRTIAVVLALVMVLGMAGCGGSTKKPESTATSTTKTEPKKMVLTSAMISDMKEFYGDKSTVGAWLALTFQMSGMEIKNVSVDITKQEKFDDYSYLFYYTLHYDTTNYQHASSNLRVAVEAYEDSSQSEGYSFETHCYEGSSKLW